MKDKEDGRALRRQLHEVADGSDAPIGKLKGRGHQATWGGKEIWQRTH